MNTVCPDAKCQNIVSEEIFKKVLSKEEFAKYMKFIMESFVTLSKNSIWCPGKGCGQVCNSKLGEAVDIHCTCGISFCYGCRKSAHAPISCSLLAKWNRTNNIQAKYDLSEDWVEKFTK